MPQSVSSPSRRKRSSLEARRQTEAIHYRHLSKGALVQRYTKLVESGKCFLEKFEELTIKYRQVQENNKVLAAKNAELLHDNETLRSQIEKINKDQSVKLLAARREYQELVDKIRSIMRISSSSIANEINNHDPLSILDQIYERSLTFDDISHLENLTSSRTKFNRTLEEKQQLREQSKEKVNEKYDLHINLSAVTEEPSPISISPSTRHDESTFSVTEHSYGNTTLVPTPSFRRFIPKTPEQVPGSYDSSPATSEDDWEYNSELFPNPLPETIASTSLDSIQNFEPKTPSLGGPPLSSSTCSSTRPKIRQSATYPEKTPEKSPPKNTRRARGKSKRLLSDIASSTIDMNSTEESTLEENSSLRRSARIRKKVCYNLRS